MNFNTLLIRLGIDPDNFTNCDNEPVKEGNTFIYSVDQRTDIHVCPSCHSTLCHIHDYDIVEINCSETDMIKDIVRIRKVRFKCAKCNKTFTPKINGIPRYSKVSSQTLQLMYNDFCKLQTFDEIAKRYGITRARVLQIFDDKVRYVPRRPLPEALCIDEIKFTSDPYSKYCCVLYDFKKREIVDIIRSRQMAYLDEYFTFIPVLETEKVKYFISDMYDGYSSICRRYFKKAIHIVDLFHVVNQLTLAVNRLRIATMNKDVDKDSYMYNFMKTHWKEFLGRSENISDKVYTPKSRGDSIHYSDLVFSCVKLNQEFLVVYQNVYQTLKGYRLLQFFF